MSDNIHDSTEAAPDRVAELIRAAGRREAPPDAIYQRVRADALQAFAARTGRRRRLRTGLSALAAGVVAAIILGVVMTRPAAPPQQRVAELLRATGVVEAMRPGAQTTWQTLMAGSRHQLPQGSRLRTAGDARAALALSDDITLRLDSGTSISLVSADHVALHTGRIYIDAGEQAGNQIAVTTPAGVARDIGTRFEVQYLDNQLRLRIRDGKVELSHASDLMIADAGEQLSIDGAGAVERSTIAPDARQWQWIEQIAHAPEIDGRPVRVLLNWVARETGKTLRFSDASVESEVGTTLLHGDISLLQPLQALSVMLATTDFGFAVGDDGQIEVWSKTRE